MKITKRQIVENLAKGIVEHKIAKWLDKKPIEKTSTKRLKEFIELYKKADMVISKGQGNFEALSEPGRSVFYLFMAKCPIVAKEVGCDIGDIILSYQA